VREMQSPPIVLAMTAILCVIAQVSLQRSLAKFPWDILTFDAKEICPPSPFDRLSPQQIRFRMSAIQGILLGLLAGAWTYAISWQSDAPENPVDARGAFIVLLIVASLARLLIYVYQGAAPVSLIGRVATGRLVLPGYDKILIAPAIAALLALITPQLLIQFDFPGPSWKGITVGLVASALFGIGPTLANWRLTGTHRINSLRGAEFMRV